MLAATLVTTPIQSIELSPGSAIRIPNVSWEEYEALLEAWGEKRHTRIAYSQEVLEIMSPLPAHERPNRIIAYIVTTILDAQDRDWEDFGSTTFKNKVAKVGLEPDTCFYIQNAARVRECMMSMDLITYPPPDLAIETDVTSNTALQAYTAIKVPEIWIYDSGNLKIYLFQESKYIESTTSQIFPDLPILDLIPSWVKKALEIGASKVLRDLRQQMRSRL
jgi:Uma2 family endonuclease